MTSCSSVPKPIRLLDPLPWRGRFKPRRAVPHAVTAWRQVGSAVPVATSLPRRFYSCADWQYCSPCATSGYRSTVAHTLQRQAELVAGGDGEVFRWSHLMHVPALAAASSLLSADGVEEIFRLYQTLDMILGAVGLLLLHRLYWMLGIGIWPGVAGCIFVLFSWALVGGCNGRRKDVRIRGFARFSDRLHPTSCSSPPGSRTSETNRALVAGSLLSAALLLHASAVLGAAAVLVHALRFLFDGVMWPPQPR